MRQIAGADDALIACRQMLQVRFDAVEQVVQWFVWRGFFGHRRFEIVGLRVQMAVFAPVIDQEVAAHLKQPGPGIIQRAKFGALNHGAQKGFLNQIFRQMMITDLLGYVMPQFRFMGAPSVLSA